MVSADRLKLVAGVGPLQLLFGIDELQEVLAAGELEWLPDGEAIRLRGAEVPVRDPESLFGVPAAAAFAARHLLVFRDPDRPWGLLVDDIVGVFPAESFILRDVPALLRKPGQSYRQIAVHQGRVLICCDSERLAARRSAP
ncbi:chemotaxis signal transduction protein [Geothermobacter ehrlichii]|uniref:Chemotaxis signal transduction protein n=1 Tax=Geothermobacter ehrlichii TaxID=213224 RepID=A0A5D3WLT7_9BACT|nr:chemotaxis protein CheW [Geothermobacter ehrlichii]TYO98232.1 chemotaxis signal transduction protein [Geothermobacter ehrlichii]